jgi:hypothetical protein
LDANGLPSQHEQLRSWLLRLHSWPASGSLGVAQHSTTPRLPHLPSPSPSSLLAVATEDGENPKAIGGCPSRGLGLGCKRSVKAVQGQRCSDARGLGACAWVSTWSRPCGRRHVFRRGS